jgi:hypothetical protein
MPDTPICRGSQTRCHACVLTHTSNLTSFKPSKSCLSDLSVQYSYEQLCQSYEHHRVFCVEGTSTSRRSARTHPCGHCQVVWCRKGDFSCFVHTLTERTIDDLMLDSPFDPKWMKGVIASNCVVLALLEQAGADVFVPSDLSIAQGLASQVA